MIAKTRSHLTQNESLLFEMSSPGKRGYQLPELDVPAVDAVEALGAGNVRGEIEGRLAPATVPAPAKKTTRPSCRRAMLVA